MKKVFNALRLWFDSDAFSAISEEKSRHHINWLRLLPFMGCHLACLLVFWVGVSPVAVGVCVASYVLRAFSLTAFYHRYFSHRTFRTSRWFQFLFALIGAAAVQRGALWWAAHHRAHHKYTDQIEDEHSPLQHGFIWSHFFWFTTDKNFKTRTQYIKEWLKYPELVFLNRYDMLVPVIFAVSLFFLGEALASLGVHTDGYQLLVWGFFVSTVLLYHATFAVNSVAHLFGSRRFETKDNSRNNWLVAFLTLGEGWHNNHHYWPSSVRQGFRRWEFDVTYYVLRLFALFGLVWDLREPPKELLGHQET